MEPAGGRGSTNGGVLGTSRRVAWPALVAALCVLATAATLLARGPATEAVLNGHPPAPVTDEEAAPDDAPQAVATAEKSTASVVQTDLEDLVTAELAGQRFCAFVVDEGTPVVEHSVDVPLIPASTQKVLVGAAALAELGPDHRFTTEVVSAAPPVAGAVGDLWLVGGADPFLATPEYARQLGGPRWQEHVLTPLWALADHLVEAGVREVHGNIYGDASRHDPARYLASWPERYYGSAIGQLSALSVDRGFVSRGVPADDPPRHAAGELIRLLEDRGVTVHGEAATLGAPPESTRLAQASSAPMVEMLPGMLAASDNHAAELITREIGLHRTGTGSTAAGTAAAVEILAEHGIDVSGVTLVDGSGLDRGNRVTCRALAETVAAEIDGVRFHELLAVAGRSGTLHARFRGTSLEGRLYGKSGWIRDVVGLTGVIAVDGGAVFAFLQNNAPSYGGGRAAEDRLLTRMGDQLWRPEG